MINAEQSIEQVIHKALQHFLCLMKSIIEAKFFLKAKLLTLVYNILGKNTSVTSFLLSNGDILGSSTSTCLNKCQYFCPSSFPWGFN